MLFNIFQKKPAPNESGEPGSASDSLLKKILLLFLILIGLFFGKAFLIPLSVGTVIATLFLPFCKWLERKKIPRGLASLACLLTLLIVIGGIGALLGWEISELTKDIPLIKLKVLETGISIQNFILGYSGISTAQQSQLLDNQQPFINDFLQSLAGSLPYIFASFILIIAYVFLLLFYRGHIRQFLLQLYPVEQHVELVQVINSATLVSQQYLVGLTKMIACLWVMYSIGFSILGVKHAIFFAILCGVLEIIPFIGNMTGTALTILMAAIQGASLPVLGGIIFVYGFIQFIQGWFLEPLLVGPQVKINPFFTIIALVCGELLWGIPGLFLAIPLIAMLKIVCDHIEGLKPYGFLMGAIAKPKTELEFVQKIKKVFSK